MARLEEVYRNAFSTCFKTRGETKGSFLEETSGNEGPEVNCT